MSVPTHTRPAYDRGVTQSRESFIFKRYFHVITAFSFLSLTFVSLSETQGSTRQHTGKRNQIKIVQPGPRKLKESTNARIK